MFAEIEKETDLLSKRFFTGQVRFGIEHGIIRGMSLTTKMDRDSMLSAVKDIKTELQKLYPDETEFYGAIEFYFSFGKLLSANYSVNLQGEKLAEVLRDHQCRSVRVVARK